MNLFVASILFGGSVLLQVVTTVALINECKTDTRSDTTIYNHQIGLRVLAEEDGIFRMLEPDFRALKSGKARSTTITIGEPNPKNIHGVYELKFVKP